MSNAVGAGREPRAPGSLQGPSVHAGGDGTLQGAEWAALLYRLLPQIDRGGREWTLARRKSSMQRVLEGSRSDPVRLLQRLQSLLSAWESDRPGAQIEADGHPETVTEAEPESETETGTETETETETRIEVAAGAVSGTHQDTGMPAADVVSAGTPTTATTATTGTPGAWAPLWQAVHPALAVALGSAEPAAQALARTLSGLAGRIASEGATPVLAAAVAQVCEQARPVLQHRHHLVDELAALSRSLAGGLCDLAEDGSWVQGQCQNLQARLAEAPTPRSVRAAGALFEQTRRGQQGLLQQRHAAREALQQLIGRMLSEVGELDGHTGRFQQAIGDHAQAVAAATSLDDLASAVRSIIDDSRAVHGAVQDSRQRMARHHSHAAELQARVQALETELRALADAVATDPLTQVANRRGLEQAFASLSAQALREQAPAASSPSAPAAVEAPASTACAPLAVALLDIDNFKRLNDTLGHAAGDLALQALARAVRERLRPGDHLARFGGEEFVVLLPQTPPDEAQQVLTRLQRGLSASLFMHEQREVFVTFSAGVTGWRPGEALSEALERADQALYEAKRGGKNRSCVA